MPKGFTTQGVCILLERPVSLDEIQAALSSFEIRARREAAESWAFGGPSLIISYRPDVNGYVVVDTVDQPWPDDMGDPQADAMVFGAWTMGNFGPFAYPGGLQRAGQQCWVWEPGRTIASRHRAFIRVQSSYVLGAGGDAPVMPEDYQPIPELEFVTRVASALVGLSQVLCYFNPNGEVLRDQDLLRASLNHAWSRQIPPLDVWANIRLFTVTQDWSLMDSVGNGQLDIPDLEAGFHSKSYDMNAVDGFLRNLSLYILQNGDVIADGDTVDGPGGIQWLGRKFENGITDPPRSVIRWLPMDSRPVPREIRDAGKRA